MRDAPLRIYLAGASGIGKTTVGRQLAQMRPRTRFHEGSRVFLEATGVDPQSASTHLSLHRDQNDAAMHRILSTNDPVIVAGHFYLSQHLATHFTFGCLLMAPLSVLLERRRGDVLRRRSLVPTMILEECEELYARCTALVAASHLPCFVVPALGSPAEIVAHIGGIVRLMAGMRVDR